MTLKPYRFVPTWRLGLYILVNLAVFFAALNYQKNALHWLAYSCCSLMLLGSLYSRWVANRLPWHWEQPEHVFANETWNVSSIPMAPAGVFGEGDIHHADNEIKTSQLGIVLLKVSTWTTEYPLGLYRVHYKLPSLQPIWVYPQPLNHRLTLTTSVREPDWTSIREYQHGDRPKLVIKKTQSFPTSHWQVRSQDDADVAQKAPTTEIDWGQLPPDWSPLEKLQQLSYDIHHLSEVDNFSLVLPHGHLSKGNGMPHKHHAWKLLAQEWEHWS